MQTSKRLVDKSYACARRAEEELIVIPVEVSVEAGQLGWCEIRVIRRLIVFILEAISATKLHHNRSAPSVHVR